MRSQAIQVTGAEGLARSTPTGACLILEDDERVAKIILRIASPIVGTVAVSTVREALAAVASAVPLCGLVADMMLPDGSGLEVVEAFRAKYPTHPALVVTAVLDRTLVNRSSELGVGYVCKPDVLDNLTQFFASFGTNEQKGKTDLGIVPPASFARDHGLSPREAQIVKLVAEGVPRARLADLLGVSQSTVKSQVRSLLRKTRCNRVSEVVWAVRRSSGVVKRFTE